MAMELPSGALTLEVASPSPDALQPCRWFRVHSQFGSWVSPRTNSPPVPPSLWQHDICAGSTMIVSRDVVEQPVAALEAGESVSATVMITRDQVSARPRSPATAESRA